MSTVPKKATKQSDTAVRFAALEECVTRLAEAVEELQGAVGPMLLERKRARLLAGLSALPEGDVQRGVLQQQLAEVEGQIGGGSGRAV